MVSNIKGRLRVFKNIILRPILGSGEGFTMTNFIVTHYSQGD